MSSRGLVEKAAGGCRESFAALVTSYYARIYRLAWRFCGSQTLAEDIAQDVCVKLATGIRGYRGEAAFSTWVWRITYTTAIDRMRDHREMRSVEPAAMAALADSREDSRVQSPENRVMSAELWQAVRRLPPQQRDAVLLVYGEDMSHAEAASVMGCQEKTVSWHLHEAKKRLKTNCSRWTEGMTRDELHALKDLPAPEPREAARDAALAAALAAFDAAAKNADGPAQENAAPGRLTLASTQTQRSRLMRANYLNYKIAASIAVLIVAVPMAFYLMRQERPPVLTAAPDSRSATSGENLYAPANKAGTPAPESKSVRARLRREGTLSAVAPNPFGSATTPSPAMPAPAPAAKPVPSEHAALAKEQFDQSQVFRFGAASGFGGGQASDSKVPNKDTQRLVFDDTLLFDTNKYSGWDQIETGTRTKKENRNQFEAFISNPAKQVIAEPVSTFSIDVDTASYSFVRRSLLAGRMPPKDAVRVEEMINYFPYAYPRPESAAVPFQPTVTVTPSPWKSTNKLVHIGIKGYEIAAKERPRANLVLLIDVSGSMAPEDRLPLLKNAFRMLLDELKPDDTVGIVTYASQSGVALEPMRVAERGKIVEVLNRLIASGSTNGGSGLQDAYRLAEMHFDKNAVNRIILATDGDFNVGITDREQLKRFIEAKRQTGIYLSVIGVGHDNYNDRLMQALAQNGNGVAVYVDTLNEARKVLVDEASSSLFPIAKDVKIQIEFNPAQVSEYRLIGYETRALKREDFNNDKVDAGDIGSGHTVTAIYEITPVGAPKFVDDLRYQKPETQPAPPSGSGGELGFLKIRYKLPGEETSKLITVAINAGSEHADIQAAPEDVRFSIAVAAFGQLLRGEPYTGGFSFDDAIALGQTARGTDPFGYRAEFLNLVRLAKSARQ